MDPTPPDDPAALRALAERYLERDQPAEAAAVYTRLLDLTPDDVDAWEGRAWAGVAAGQTEGVRAGIAALLERFPEHAGVAATVGELYQALGERAEALHAFDRATALAGADSDTLYRVARDFESVAAPEPALALYERLIPWRPREVRLARAGLYLEQGDLQAGLVDLDAALAAPPGGSDRRFDALSTARVFVARARIHMGLAHAEAAAVDARAAVELAPDDVETAPARAMLAQLALARRSLPEARLAAEKAVQQDPTYMSAWVILANTYSGANDLPGALAAIHRGQEHHPTEPHLVLMAALIRGEMDDFAGAVEEWDRLLTILPDNATALAMRGAVYLQLGKMREARADVDRALALDPVNLTALQTRVSLQLRAGNLPAVVSDLDRALAVDPHDTDLLLLRGQVHLERRDLLAAAADYTRLLEVAPGSPAGLSGIGNVQMLLGQYEKALHTYEEALRAAPGSGAGLYNLAAAQAMLGRCPQAGELLRRALAADPRLVADATTDEFFAGCHDQPGFAAAVQGGPAPAGRGKPPAKGRR